jgi:hypothetical protein
MNKNSRQTTVCVTWFVGYGISVKASRRVMGGTLTVLKPEFPGVLKALPLPTGNISAFSGYGSSIPRARTCFLLTSDAATMANVVRTTPMPQENTSAVFKGSVAVITRRYASR